MTSPAKKTPAESDGTGWHMLLIRGLARECGHWHDFPDHLRSRLPGLGDVLCIDLPGVGRNSAAQPPWTVPKIAAAVRSSWLTCGPEHGRWCLVATSLGGMVAMAWAERHPQDLGGVVLINTSSGRIAGPFSRMRPAALVDIVRGGFIKDLVRRERLILHRLTNLVQGERFETLVAERARIAAARPVSRKALIRQMIAATRFRGPKERLRVPALVVVSEADRLTAPSCSHRLAALLDAPLASHPDAGHDPPIDDPEWTADVIGSWLPEGV